ncbi:MAG TPA: Bax inhibitor-1/YccA family protein [Candidatus Eisenbacteria bacterium]|nr:Bax inhibitor-1/YccA family protein [Candidatus Eisenbacteria bacterium]
MKTSNPALGQNTFRDVAGFGGDTMTVSGAVNKAGILMLLCVASAAWTWNRFFATGDPSTVAPMIMIGGIGGFILALVTIFKKEWAGITAPLYALAEGALLGGISAMFELSYKGIAIQAVMLTFGTLVAMLLVYRSGLIKVNDKFRIGVFAATGGIALFYLAQFVLGFFGITFHTINSGTPLGIGFSLLVVGIAALNLVLDFDMIEQGARYNAPKYMEWYSAFALMVTLIWLYLEILRLLAKFRSRD